MKPFIVGALAAGLFVPVPVLASGSSSPRMPPAASSIDPYHPTESLRAEVLKINPNGTVKVRDLKDGHHHLLSFGSTTKFEAEDRREFGGRKRLKATDLAVGQELKIDHRPATGEVVNVKILIREM